MNSGPRLSCPFVCACLLVGCCQRPVPAPQDAGKIAAATRTEPQPAPGETPPSFVELFARASGSVVNVSAAHPLPYPEELLPRREREILRALVRSLGSGFVFDDQGHVVTCSSVVQNAEEIEVILANGRRLQAHLVGSDDITDLAVLSIPAADAPPPLPQASAASLEVGDWVAAFGYPFGLSHSITAGIVSAVRSGDEMNASHGIILSDAAINPGCNGGPLVDTRGRVVGINLIPGQSEGGMGLAIPIEDAVDVLDLLKSGRMPRRPWLGIHVQDMDERLAASFGMQRAEGALVSRVHPGGPGAGAGLEAGDVIVSFAGRPVDNATALVEAVKNTRPGRKITLRIVRLGKKKTLRITPQLTPR